MPISIVGLDGSGSAWPVPVVSALVEFGSALHVLRDPGHHGADGWAAAVRATMSPRLAGWTESWWWTTQAIRSSPFVTAAPPGDEFSARLGQLRAMPRAAAGHAVAAADLTAGGRAGRAALVPVAGPGRGGCRGGTGYPPGRGSRGFP